MKKKNARGNVVFVILIAIAILAALAFTITRGSRNKGGGSNTEYASLKAGQVLQYMQLLTLGIDRLLAAGCTPEQISFEGASLTGLGYNYNNLSSPSSKACWIFDAAGAGLKYQDAPFGLLDSSLSSKAAYGRIVFDQNMSIEGSYGTASPSYSQYIVVPFVRNDVCLDVNKRLFGLTAIPTDADTWAWIPFQGSFDPGYYFGCTGGPSGAQCGNQVGCFRLSNATFDGGSTFTGPLNILYMLGMHNPE